MSIIEIENKTPKSLIAGPVTAFLENQSKQLNEQVLHEMIDMFKRSIIRQLMQPRDSRAGRESCTTYTHPCARKARYTYDGVEKPPVQARTLLKFILGDLVELAVIGIARLAGLDIGCNNMDLTIRGLDGRPIPVHPDGLLSTHRGLFNVEIKSCDSRTFDRWLDQGGPSDDWGYRTQASVEGFARQEAGYPVEATVFVAVSTGTRQGSIAEWTLPFDQSLLDQWHTRRSLRQQAALPPVPFETVPETTYMKGKALDEDLINAVLRWGAPVPRQNKNGLIYGWDVPTGRRMVPTTCSYCDYKLHCYPGAEMEEQGGKPVWIVPTPRKKVA